MQQSESPEESAAASDRRRCGLLFASFITLQDAVKIRCRRAAAASVLERSWRKTDGYLRKLLSGKASGPHSPGLDISRRKEIAGGRGLARRWTAMSLFMEIGRAHV